MNRFSISKQQVENSPVRAIGIIAYPGVEVIDIVGPMEVFTLTNFALQREGLITDPVYQIILLGKDDQPITTLSGLQIGPMNSYGTFEGSLDTLIIPGGGDPEGVAKDTELVDWIRNRSKDARRVASVCNGTFVMAESGLLDGRMATTHWDYTNRFKNNYPLVEMESDRIFVRDGPVWSSGGITSGIDLALAMLEEDWGHKLALHIARYLVVFLKRQGGQSQYSAYLTTDASNRQDLRELQSWIMENPGLDLRVEVLAERVAMSPRNFARIFQKETGVTPAKYVEMVRVDLAKHYLESTRLNVSVIAEKAGFKDAETMQKTFFRHIGINPIDYRARFGSTSANDNQIQFDDYVKPGQAVDCSSSIVLEQKENTLSKRDF